MIFVWEILGKFTGIPVMTSFMTSSEDVIWVNPSISLFSYFENINRRYYHLLFYYHISGGSRISHRGGVDSRGGYVLEFFTSKRKNLDPWGTCAGHAPSRSTNACDWIEPIKTSNFRSNDNIIRMVHANKWQNKTAVGILAQPVGERNWL